MAEGKPKAKAADKSTPPRCQWVVVEHCDLLDEASLRATFEREGLVRSASVVSREAKVATVVYDSADEAEKAAKALSVNQGGWRAKGRRVLLGSHPDADGILKAARRVEQLAKAREAEQARQQAMAVAQATAASIAAMAATDLSPKCSPKLSPSSPPFMPGMSPGLSPSMSPGFSPLGPQAVPALPGMPPLAAGAATTKADPKADPKKRKKRNSKKGRRTSQASPPEFGVVGRVSATFGYILPLQPTLQQQPAQEAEAAAPAASPAAAAEKTAGGGKKKAGKRGKPQPAEVRAAAEQVLAAYKASVHRGKKQKVRKAYFFSAAVVQQAGDDAGPSAGNVRGLAVGHIVRFTRLGEEVASVERAPGFEAPVAAPATAGPAAGGSGGGGKNRRRRSSSGAGSQAGRGRAASGGVSALSGWVASRGGQHGASLKQAPFTQARAPPEGREREERGFQRRVQHHAGKK